MWLPQLNQLTIPVEYGDVQPFIHWSSPTTVVLVWQTGPGAAPDLPFQGIFAWPMTVDLDSGLLDQDPTHIHRLGPVLVDEFGQKDSLTRLEALEGGGFVLHGEYGTPS